MFAVIRGIALFRLASLRREYLRRMFFWNRMDLEQRLEKLQSYYDQSRVHQSLEGATSDEKSAGPTAEPAGLEHYSWRSHWHGLFELSVAAEH